MSAYDIRPMDAGRPAVACSHRSGQHPRMHHTIRDYEPLLAVAALLLTLVVVCALPAGLWIP